MNVSVLVGILKRAASLLLKESLLSLEKIISFHRQLDAQQIGDIVSKMREHIT